MFCIIWAWLVHVGGQIIYDYIWQKCKMLKVTQVKIFTHQLWAECSLIIGPSCWVKVFCLILDSSVGSWVGIESAGDLVSETSQLRILLSVLSFKKSLACARASKLTTTNLCIFLNIWGWVGLWGFLWWAPSANGKDHHGVSSGWSSVWHRSNTGLSSTQYEQIPIILGVWPFWLTPFFFRSITFWWAYG